MAATKYGNLKVYNCTGKQVALYDRGNPNIVNDTKGVKCIIGPLCDCRAIHSFTTSGPLLSTKFSYKSNKYIENRIFTTRYVSSLSSFKELLDESPNTILIVNKKFAEAAYMKKTEGYNRLYFPATPVYTPDGKLKGFLNLVNYE